MLSCSLTLTSLDETKALARTLSNVILSGTKLLTLKGDLGSGKTTICRQIIRYITGKELQVNSPTFNILQIYQSDYGSIYHYDLYRIKNISELYELDLEEACNEWICLIEWPEIAMHLLPDHRTDLEITDSDNLRQATLTLPDQHSQLIRRLS